jgi:hypothetical protein
MLLQIGVSTPLPPPHYGAIANNAAHELHALPNSRSRLHPLCCANAKHSQRSEFHQALPHRKAPVENAARPSPHKNTNPR